MSFSSSSHHGEGGYGGIKGATFTTQMADAHPPHSHLAPTIPNKPQQRHNNNNSNNHHNNPHHRRVSERLDHLLTTGGVSQALQEMENGQTEVGRNSPSPTNVASYGNQHQASKPKATRPSPRAWKNLNLQRKSVVSHTSDSPTHHMNNNMNNNMNMNMNRINNNVLSTEEAEKIANTNNHDLDGENLAVESLYSTVEGIFADRAQKEKTLKRQLSESDFNWPEKVLDKSRAARSEVSERASHNIYAQTNAN